MSRYYLAAKESAADIIVRITSDCPLIDPVVTDQVVNYFIEKQIYELVTNAELMSQNGRTLAVWIQRYFLSLLLEKAFRLADKPYQHEHVTPYIYENSPMIYFYQNVGDYSSHRWTLDTQEDCC